MSQGTNPDHDAQWEDPCCQPSGECQQGRTDLGDRMPERGIPNLTGGPYGIGGDPAYDHFYLITQITKEHEQD